jgi:hypothetical protein
MNAQVVIIFPYCIFIYLEFMMKSTFKFVMMMHDCNSCTEEAEAGELRIQGLHNNGLA